mgnify:CR=1 FL=1
MKYAIFFALFLCACGTEVNQPIEYKGRLTDCQLSSGERDTDYFSMLVFTNDPAKVLFGVGAVQGTDTLMLMSEAEVSQLDSGLTIKGTFDPVGKDKEPFGLSLEHVSYGYEGITAFVPSFDFSEKCKTYFKPADEVKQ